MQLPFKPHTYGYTMQNLWTTNVPDIHDVENDCNMIEFAKSRNSQYNPDSGNCYYELMDDAEEYISRDTDVVLISEVCVPISQ